MIFKNWGFGSKAKIGTAQNPEIIDPRLPQPRPGRLRFIMQIFMWMVSVSIPAVFFDMIWLWLFDLGSKQGDFFAWILLILCSPPALLFSLIAFVANLFLLFLLSLAILGKPLAGTPPFIRRTSQRFKMSRFSPPG